MREVVRHERVELESRKAKPSVRVADNMPPIGNLLPSMAEILRKQSTGNWLMPYLSAITPTYIESVLRGGIAGNHQQMHQLFDLMYDSDPEIQACIGEYNDGIMAKKFIFTPYQEDDEEPSPMAEEKCKLVRSALAGMRPDAASGENNLTNTVKDLAAARFFGTSVLEVDWYDTYGSGGLNFKRVPGFDDPVLLPRSTYWVNPVCYGWNANGRCELLMPKEMLRPATIKEMAKKGLPPYSQFFSTSQPPPPQNQFSEFPVDKFLIAINNGKTGTPLATSVLRCLAWWWCASNFCGDYLMKCAELFGVPFRSATYAPGTTEPVKQEIRQMLQACGSTGWALLPEGAVINFEKATGLGGQSPQAFLHQFADSQKRKVILHQTMTGGGHDSMGKGGGKAFGDVEADKTDICIASGARFACDILNEQLIPSVLRQNYGDDGDMEAPMVSMIDENVGGLEDAQKYQILSTFMDIPESKARRFFAIPKPQPGEEICGVDCGVQGAAAQAQERMQNQQMQQQQEQAQMQADALAQQPQQAAEARNALEAGGSTSEAGCLMAMVPDGKWKTDFFNFARTIEDDTLAGDGVETDVHVTAFYGFKTDFDVSKLAKLLADVGPLTFTVGKLSRFECEEYDVLKFDITSSQLVKLNKVIAAKFKDDINPSQHAYAPHLTLAYVAKGTNKAIGTGGDLVGKKFTVDSLLYSLPKREGRETLQTAPFHGKTTYQECGHTNRCRCDGHNEVRTVPGKCPVCKSKT